MKKLVTLLAAILLPALAFASPSDSSSDDEPEDFDAEMEQHSKFWESVANPNRDLYKALLDKADKLIARRDKQSQAQTEKLIRHAVRIAPKQAAAWWALGAFHDRNHSWSQCAKARQKAYALEPDFEPKRSGFRHRAGTMAQGLGRCLAHAGHFTAALEQFKRDMAQEYAQWGYPLRVGEAYMALGRLKEAIAAMEASAQQSSYRPSPRYALAVAYDRDEQLAKSRAKLDWALGRDRGLNHLYSESYHEIIPAYDRFYYQGLARERKLEHERALFHFRQFVAEGKKSPWLRRARQHIAELERVVIETKRIQVENRNDAKIDRALLASHISRASSKLQACVRGLPHAVFQARIVTLVGKGTQTYTPKKKKAKPKKKPVSRYPRYPRYRGHYRSRYYRRPYRPRPPPPLVAGTSIDLILEWQSNQAEITKAKECIESVVKSMKLPRPKGPQGGGVAVTFPIIKR